MLAKQSPTIPPSSPIFTDGTWKPFPVMAGKNAHGFYHQKSRNPAPSGTTAVELGIQNAVPAAQDAGWKTPLEIPGIQEVQQLHELEMIGFFVPGKYGSIMNMSHIVLLKNMFTCHNQHEQKWKGYTPPFSDPCDQHLSNVQELLVMVCLPAHNELWNLLWSLGLSENRVPQEFNGTGVGKYPVFAHQPTVGDITSNKPEKGYLPISVFFFPVFGFCWCLVNAWNPAWVIPREGILIVHIPASWVPLAKLVYAGLWLGQNLQTNLFHWGTSPCGEIRSVSLDFWLFRLIYPNQNCKE